jgi:hypothetical protein
MKPLRELLIKLNDNSDVRITFLYSVSIYSSILEGYPDEKMGIKILADLKERVNRLSEISGIGQDYPPYVFNEQSVGKEILPHKGNIAMIGDGDRQGTIIWFDDDSMDLKESLSDIIDNIGFEQLTHPYFF